MENSGAAIPEGLFCTPKDRFITSKLMKMKGIDWASKELSRRRYEKFARQTASANCMRITADSFNEIYRGAVDLCVKLGINVPDMYLQRSDKAAAYCLGETKPLLIITSSLLKQLNTSEVLVVLAQALVHIHSGHMKTYMMRELLAAASDNFGIFKSVVALPRTLLEEWAIEAEISADRGMLVLNKDPELVLAVYAKLATEGLDNYSVESLLADYNEYLKNTEQTPACPVFRAWSDLYNGNEHYIYRMGRMKEFAGSDEYQRWSDGDYVVATDDDTVEDDSVYYDGLGVRGEAWEAEDVHARIAWGLPDTKATAEFLRIHLGDMLKVGIDGARDVTAEMVAGLGNFFSEAIKKDKK